MVMSPVRANDEPVVSPREYSLVRCQRPLAEKLISARRVVWLLN